MQLSISHFKVANPESWLIILIYALIWGYSYYSLVILLFHLRQQNNPTEEAENFAEITN